ncbi:hypothetical protein [uncultured Aquimarina sp.]|jgi:hypothetical protein|uniref:hypothetical protein n=1 Tax=uncultured Aquimarina sp. TaxID=575652 RepID=UPI0026027D55|nr:hypothetical protein [uncultured Aquimarina sp.]
MNATQNIGISFYQNLGKLFYAIAASDKIVRESEYATLKNLVKSAWLAVDDLEDEFGADAAFQIEIIFDWLDYSALVAEDSFNEFKDFYQENKSLFTDKVRKLVWDTSNSIANAFSGKNKSELMMLGRLKLIFEQ